MKRKWVASARYDYVAVDYYECPERPTQLAGQQFPADHWFCHGSVFTCRKPQKLAHKIADALNAAYHSGREDAGKPLPPEEDTPC